MKRLDTEESTEFTVYAMTQEECIYTFDFIPSIGVERIFVEIIGKNTDLYEIRIDECQLQIGGIKTSYTEND